jgi:replication fork protection complex subunit Tof1/Swi1
MLQSNIFYEKAILDLAVQICYYHPSQPPEYQIELVTMLHVFLKMVEHYTKQQSVVFVRQRRRRFRKRKRTRRGKFIIQ